MPIDQFPLLSGATRLGHISEFRGGRLEMLSRAVRESEVVRVRFLHRSVLLVSGAEVAHEVIVEKAKHFEKSPGLRILLHRLAGQGLFTSEGELWRRQRKLMAPLFHPSQIGAYAELMRETALRTAGRWKDGDTIDVGREMTRLTMAIVGKALFDTDTFDEADELGEALTLGLDWAGEQSAASGLVAQLSLYEALESLRTRVPRWLSPAVDGLARINEAPILLPGAYSSRLRKAMAMLDGKIQQMIDERRASGLRHNDLLTRLLAARDEDDATAHGMTDRQVRDEAATLFVAGHETTATALTWAIHLLAKRPDVLARVRAEADAIGRDGPTFADAARLTTTTRVFKEALRLYPPVIALPRRALTDVEIAGVALPAGTIIFVSIYGIHRQPGEFPDPERFDPDHFTPEAEARRPRGAYLPFGAGPRVCIGNHFAMLEGPLVLATLLRDFEISVDPALRVVPGDGATLRPSTPISARIRTRGPRVRRLPVVPSSVG